jgi:hypothetical protein
MGKYYKTLDKDGCSCHGGEAEWSLPQRNEDGTWTPGEWMPEIEGELKPCRNGYHVVTLEQLPDWLGERIFEVEVGKEILPDDDKSVVRTCRLVRECTGWNDHTARLFACDCAEHVLCLYEAQYPDDRRPRKAIETTRRYAEGKAAVEALTAAREAAGVAAEAAAEAAREAAGVAAEAAAGAAEGAAEGAAGAAAWAAVWAAAGAAWDAAWAAREAAGVAAEAATWDPTLDVERQWQAGRLREILEVEA